MTDYNDGKWHGWNGGKCPVHPETVVEVRYSAEYENDSTGGVLTAGVSNCWSHSRPVKNRPNKIVAFRVLKEHREPREWWVNVYREGVAIYSSKKYAEEVVAEDAETIRVREVMDDDE